MIIEAIFIADAALAAPTSVSSASAIAGRGLRGDRYEAGVGAFSKWPGEGRSLTLIAAESIEALSRDHGIQLAPGQHRRNVVVRGGDLMSLQGKKFRIGSTLLEGIRPAAPCKYLEKHTFEGILKAMEVTGGGLRAEIVQGGALDVGDTVEEVAACSASRGEQCACEV